jgi:hypothetical protein
MTRVADYVSRTIEPKESAMTNLTVTIRRASAADATSLERLAILDSSSPPTGDALLADVGGELWAAVEIEGGAAIADPFRPSGELVDLLRYRVELMRSEQGGAAARLLRFLPRAA